MKFIRPTPIADAMLTSSTAPENDFPEWSAAIPYAVGDKRIKASTHRIYQSVQAANINHDPETAGVSWWVNIGPTNQRAMFDNVVGTVTEIASPLTVVMRPGSLSGVALMELAGRSATVTLKDAPGGTVAYTKTIDLDGSLIGSFYDWFYQPYVQGSDLVLSDLPFHYPTCELTISITGTGTVQCGVCKVGEVIYLGDAEAGATSGIVDYSPKVRDEFGNYSISERSFSKRMSVKLVTSKADYNRISRALASVRATPCVWITTDAPQYEPLMIYGFYKDFSIDVAYPTMHYCSLEIEGLI